jgi:peptide/nickel transport system substrate-binding protein
VVKTPGTRGGSIVKRTRGVPTLIAAGVAASIALSSAAALAQDASPSIAGKVSFVAGTTNDMRTVNPLRALEGPEYEVLSLNYNLLVNFAKDDLGPAPGLATEWSQSEDGLTWTFAIRDGMTWQDGEPVTAEDVAFTFSKAVEYNIGTVTGYLPYSTPESFTAPDPLTFVWTTEVPTIAPTVPPWVYIVPEHLWGDLDKDGFKEWNFEPGVNDSIGSGPFQLTEWIKGDSWTMTANPDYWGGAPKIDEYVVKRFNNEEAMVTALKNGEIDYLSGIGPELFDSLEGQSGVSTWVGPATTFAQMTMNSCDPENTVAEYCADTGSTGHPALLDPVVRTAIAHAIDKDTLVERILGGYGEPGETIVPPFAAQWHYSPTEDEAVTFDIAAANEILDGAGYVDTDGDGVREMPGGGEPLDFRFILRSEEERAPDMGRFISGWLSQIGIATRSEVLTDGKLINAWYANDYDMWIWGWGPDPDPDFILSTFTSGQCGSWSDTCYSNPEYDQLYQDQKTASDTAERQAIINEMQQIIYRDVPEVVLFYDKFLEAYRSDEWTGLEDNISPTPEGFLWGQFTPYTALTLAPIASGGSAGDDSSGVSPVVWLGILGAIVIVVAAVLLSRRKRSDEDTA